jgi:hypothetical protein
MAKPETKTVNITLRISEALRARIAAVADVRDVSLNAEMAIRLEQSFDQRDAIWGGPHTVEALKTFAAIINAIEDQTGEPWTNDESTAQTVSTALYRLMGDQSRLIPRDDTYRRQHQREIAIDAIMAFAAFGGLDLKTQTKLAQLIGAEH